MSNLNLPHLYDMTYLTDGSSMVVKQQGSNEQEGNTKAMTTEINANDAQPLATPSEATASTAEAWQLPSLTLELPRGIEETGSIMKTSTEKVSLPMVPNQEMEKVADDTNKEVFHTPIIKDEQVTKTRDANAAINDEGDIHDFDEMLDMDTLYGSGGLSYPFDNEPTGNTDRKTHPNDSEVKGKAHTNAVEKESEASDT